MTLTLEIFGIELAKVTLDIELPGYAPNLEAAARKPRVFVEHAIERGVKAVSKSWVRRMMASS